MRYKRKKWGHLTPSHQSLFWSPRKKFRFPLFLIWCGRRSKDECFINGIESGRTEGENQHHLQGKYQVAKCEVALQRNVKQKCESSALEWREHWPERGRWLPRYSQVSVTDHWHTAGWHSKWCLIMYIVWKCRNIDIDCTCVTFQWNFNSLKPQ